MSSIKPKFTQGDSRTERIKTHQAEAALELLKRSKYDSGCGVDSSSRIAGLRKLQEEADLKLAEDLLGFHSGSGIIPSVEPDSRDPDGLDTFSIFKPETNKEFETLCDILARILAQNFRHPYYPRFCENLFMRLAKDLPVGEIRKIGGMLTRESDEMLKELAFNDRKESNTGK